MPKQIGTVTHWYDKLGVAVIKLTGKLSKGDEIMVQKGAEEFEEKVRSGSYEGMPFEGVVCKGPYESPGRPLMFKIKNRAWLEKLKTFCKGNEALYDKLA